MLNFDLIKIISIYSFIIGIILGFIPIIPFLTGIAFILVMFFCSPFVIIQLYKLKLIKEIEIPKCLSIGALSGFCAFWGFSVVYFPLALILYLIFKINSFLWIKVLVTNILFGSMIIFLTALLSGLMNMFSAFLCVYVYEYLKLKKRG